MRISKRYKFILKTTLVSLYWGTMFGAILPAAVSAKDTLISYVGLALFFSHLIFLWGLLWDQLKASGKRAPWE